MNLLLIILPLINLLNAALIAMNRYFSHHIAKDAFMAGGFERRRVHLKRIAHVVKSERARKVCIHHRDHMAPGRIRPALGIDSMLLRKVRHPVSRNQIADLFQGSIPMLGWFVFLSFLFHTTPSGGFKTHVPAFLFNSYGMAVSFSQSLETECRGDRSPRR